MLLKNGERIVFAGDSVTDDGRAYPVGQAPGGLGNGYVRLFDNLLTVEYPSLLIDCVNMGVSGNTSDDLLARWESDITAHKPDWVVLEIGVNDVWRQFDCPAQSCRAVPPERYLKNLNAMADKTHAKMIFMTPYMMEPNKDEPMRKRLDEYGAIVKETAKKRGFLLVDLQAAFDELLKYRHPYFISWDRIHPGPVGSVVIARALLKALQED